MHVCDSPYVQIMSLNCVPALAEMKISRCRSRPGVTCWTSCLPTTCLLHCCWRPSGSPRCGRIFPAPSDASARPPLRRPVSRIVAHLSRATGRTSSDFGRSLQPMPSSAFGSTVDASASTCPICPESSGIPKDIEARFDVRFEIQEAGVNANCLLERPSRVQLRPCSPVTPAASSQRTPEIRSGPSDGMAPGTDAEVAPGPR